MTPRSPLVAACTWLLMSLAAAAAPVPKAPEAVDLATVHEEAGRVDCKDCHGAIKPDLDIAERALQTANQLCMNCHGTAANVAAFIAPRLANRHINPHASHLVSVQCVTCHVAHDEPSKAYCLQCHGFDLPMTLGKPRKTR